MVFDTETGRVVAERAVPGSVRGVARLPDGLVLVLGRLPIGPGRLAVVGPYRSAAWVGDRVLAVTGWNARRGSKGGPRFEPVGVHLVDTRSWKRRVLSPRAQWFAVSGLMVVVPVETAIAVYGHDGVERLRLPGRFGWVQAVDGRAYAWQEGGTVLVVDLGTGATSSVAVDRPLTLLGS